MVNIQEAKTQLSKLLQPVIAGEEVVIVKSGQPIARLVLSQETIVG
jgi:prevent-host-death family protein